MSVWQLWLPILVSALLVFLWRDDFTARLWLFSGELRALLMRGWVPVLFVPLFLHASAGHLVGNMVALTASGAAVEEFHGPLRTLLLYVAAGLCGAVLSLARVHTMEIGPQHVTVLAVGASGAIMGLYGVILVFLLRHRKGFPERERRKTQRIYFPLLVLALLPSLFGADLYSHVGGFVGGMLLALVVRPIEDRIPRERTEPSPEPPESLR